MSNLRYIQGFTSDHVDPIYSLLIKLSQDQSYGNKEEGLAFLESTYSKEKIAQWTKDFIITVWDSNVFVGFGRAKHDGWITHIYIDTEYQGKGIGSELLKQLEAILVQEGHKMIYLNCEPTELQFYEKRGYVPKHTEVTNYHGILFIPMEKIVR